MYKSIFQSTIILTLGLLCLVSCSKETDLTPTPDPPPPLPPTPPAVVYSTLVTQFFEIDTTIAHPNDTLLRYTYVYDDKNRLAQASLLSTRPNGDSISRATFLYEFTGTDTIAVMERLKYVYYYGSLPTSENIAYYTFTDSRYTKDSILYVGGSESGLSKCTYTYEPGVITRHLRNWINLSNGQYSANDVNRLYITKVGNNIVHMIDSGKYQVVNQSTTNFSRRETSGIYLANPNPFFRIHPARMEFATVLGLGNVTSPEYISANLISEETGNSRDWTDFTPGVNTSSYKTKYSYTFRADGYPLEVRWKSEYSNPIWNRERKGVFVYKK